MDAQPHPQPGVAPRPRWASWASPLQLYIALVVVTALGMIAAYARVDSPAARPPWADVMVFAALVVLGELFPLKVARRREAGEVTISSPFTYALLLTVGATFAIVAQAVGCIVADWAQHKPWQRIAFNAAEYSVSLAAGAAVLQLLNGGELLLADRSLRLGHLAIIVVSGAAFLLTNHLLMGMLFHLDQGVGVPAHFRRDFLFDLSTTGVLLTLSPLVVVGARENLALLVFLLIPVAAIQRSARLSMEKEHEALHDELTGLGNRAAVHAWLNQAVEEAEDTGRAVAVVIVDLDRFKDVNDTLGHHIGDLLLMRVAERLRAVSGDGAAVGRLGGDEFAIVPGGHADRAGAEQLAGRVVGALEEPVVIQGFSLACAASIGVAVHPQHGADANPLLQHAEIAMSLAKEHRSRWEVYSPQRDRHSRRALTLVAHLGQSIASGQLRLHYQPQADVASGRIVGLEALLRWQHPQLGLVLPDEFIPLAERTTLVGALTRHVLDRALAQAVGWRDAGFRIRLAVNVSAQNLYDVRFPDSVAELLGGRGLEASALELEITESTVMADPERAMGVLAMLDRMGVSLAIDDFGTGYSSLAYLKQLPVRTLKVDKSFVTGLADDEDDAVILQSTIDLARNLGLSVCAEGVESVAVWDRLAELGCDVAQGFFIARPMPAEDFARWLRDHHAAPAGAAVRRRRIPV
ncbi:MAG: EAL domain-containing protein [Actinobacteria bacterium]|nr:EAL domain-containing protein [Actinomycetota bacterium]